jgi:hypothetical protein
VELSGHIHMWSSPRVASCPHVLFKMQLVMFRFR